MTMRYRDDMGTLARQLAGQAEEVCRVYLPAGRREGHHWVVGDLDGHQGQSLRVELTGPRVGKWRDYASGEHGDLLDLIKHAEKCPSLGEAAIKARAWLTGSRTIQPQPAASPHNHHHNDDAQARTQTARRLWACTKPIANTPAAAYLARRGLTQAGRWPALRFCGATFCRGADQKTHRLPALIAKVTEAAGRFMGVHRTFLDPRRPAKATIDNPKRLLGPALGGGVRFDHPAAELLVIGEGIETVLSILEVMPGWSGAAALTASHLASFEPASSYHRIIIAADPDEAGRKAALTLREHLSRQGRAVCILEPPGAFEGDFNDMLQKAGPGSLAKYLKEKEGRILNE